MNIRHVASIATITLSLTTANALAHNPMVESEIANALTRQEEFSFGVQNEIVKLPTRGDQGVLIASETGSVVHFGLPAKGQAVSGHLNIYNGSQRDSEIAVRKTPTGVQALIHIDSQNAPERYEFPISGDVSALDKQRDGSVRALDDQGNTIALIAVPWAQDRNGTPVPTHFEIKGTALIQVIEHKSGHYVYGVTADPKWLARAIKHSWNGAKCFAYVAAAFVPANKAYKTIKALGGVKSTYKLLRGASTAGDAAKILGGSAAEIIGIDGVMSHCF